MHVPQGAGHGDVGVYARSKFPLVPLGKPSALPTVWWPKSRGVV
jgi:hypothetical protein